MYVGKFSTFLVADTCDLSKDWKCNILFLFGKKLAALERITYTKLKIEPADFRLESD